MSANVIFGQSVTFWARNSGAGVRSLVVFKSLWATETNTILSDLAEEFWATILSADSLLERIASWAGSSDTLVAFEFPSILTTSSNALSAVESESWFARLEAASVKESETGITLEENALVLLNAEVVARRAELEMALSILEVVSFSTVNLSAGVLVELITWRALISDTFVVDELEVFWALS